MSKIQKTFIYLAFISMLWVLASCSSDDSAPSPKPVVVLHCTGLQKDVAKGGTIDIPDLRCSNDSEADDEIWNGRPSGNTSWTVDPSTEASSFEIVVSATCGSAKMIWDVPCGTVKVKEAGAGSSSSAGTGTSSSAGTGSSSSTGAGSSSSAGIGSSSSDVAVTLTCTGLPTSIARGNTIPTPTLTCSNGAIATQINWNGRPQNNTAWEVSANGVTQYYTISVTAKCGTVTKTDVSCGRVDVVAAGTGSSSSRGSSSSAGGNSSSSVGGGSSSSAGGGSSSSVGGNSSSSSSSSSNSSSSSVGGNSSSSAGESSSSSSNSSRSSVSESSSSSEGASSSSSEIASSSSSD